MGRRARLLRQTDPGLRTRPDPVRPAGDQRGSRGFHTSAEGSIEAGIASTKAGKKELSAGVSARSFSRFAEALFEGVFLPSETFKNRHRINILGRSTLRCTARRFSCQINR